MLLALVVTCCFGFWIQHTCYLFQSFTNIVENKQNVPLNLESEKAIKEIRENLHPEKYWPLDVIARQSDKLRFALLI